MAAAQCLLLFLLMAGEFRVSQQQTLTLNFTLTLPTGMKVIDCVIGNDLGTAIADLNGETVVNILTNFNTILANMCSGTDEYVTCLTTNLAASTQDADKLVYNTFDIATTPLTALRLSLCDNANAQKIFNLVTCVVGDLLGFSTCSTALTNQFLNQGFIDDSNQRCSAVKAFLNCAIAVIDGQGACGTDEVTFANSSLYGVLSSNCDNTSSFSPSIHTSYMLSTILLLLATILVLCI